MGFALINLALRYAFGAYPLAKSLGLSHHVQAFLHHTVGLAPDLPPNQLMSQLLGPSVLLIVTHFHRIGALSSASFGGGVGGSGGGLLFARPRQLSVAANQAGVFPFLRRAGILHSHKLLTLAALYFSLRHVDIFGAVMLAGLLILTASVKTASGPPEILGAIAIAAAVANYVFAIDWLHGKEVKVVLSRTDTLSPFKPPQLVCCLCVFLSPHQPPFYTHKKKKHVLTRFNLI